MAKRKTTKSQRKIHKGWLLEQFSTLLLFLIFIILIICTFLLGDISLSRSVKTPTHTLTYAEQITETPKLQKSLGDVLRETEIVTPAVATPTPSPTNSYCLTVPIILYHHTEPMADATREGHGQLTVDSTIFDEQMSYLSQNGYHSISLDELVSALLNHQPLPEKSIAITIDDGYIDNYTYGFQILKKYHLKGNFMIPTGLIMNPDYMTWDNVREIQHSDVGFIYNHTWSHAPLGDISPEKIESELNLSQTQFKQQLGMTPNIFTYPYGSFSDTAIKILREHGFIAGFTTIPGRVQCDTNIMTLYREHIGNAPMSEYGL